MKGWMIGGAVVLATIAGPWAYESWSDRWVQGVHAPEWRLQEAVLRRLHPARPGGGPGPDEVRERRASLGVGQPLPTILKDVRGLMEKLNVQVVTVAVLPRSSPTQDAADVPGLRQHGVVLTCEGSHQDLLTAVEALVEAQVPVTVKRLQIEPAPDGATASSRMRVSLGVLADRADT